MLTPGAGKAESPQVQFPYNCQSSVFQPHTPGSGAWPAARNQTFEEFLKKAQKCREKQPGRAPSFASATTEDFCRGVYGLESTATQTALFTAASFRT